MTVSQHLTFMFTDIVGSTALYSSVSAVEANQIRTAHFQVLDEVLAATGGRLVSNLGDGAMVVFQSCSDAMDGAVRLQQAVLVDRHLSRMNVQLRVGLSTGDVTLEGEDYFGHPIVEAARLCALANPGQVLTTSRVRAVAGRFAPHEGEPLGAMTLKGLPEPVDVEDVKWAPLPAVEFPYPPRLRRPHTFFGRASERAALDAALEQAATTGQRLALVVGEAGIGKTALATEFALAAHSRQAIVLLGRCDEHLRAPFHPFEEALSHYVAHAPESVLAAHVKQHGAYLTRIVPQLGGRVPTAGPSPPADPDRELQAVFRAVTGLLAAASASNPVVLLLDDLHWADADSLHLLRHITASPEPQQLLIVAMYRAGDLTPAQPLTAVLGSLTRETEPLRVLLEGWGEDDIASLLQEGTASTRGMEGGEASDRVSELARLLHLETGGSPFFVTEMLHHLAETGAVRLGEDRRWETTAQAVATSLPASLREVLAERMRPIGPGGHEVLQVASVIGHDFDLEVLARATDREQEDVLDLLEAAVAAALVHETTDIAQPGNGAGGASFSFHQGLICRALHDSLAPSRRMLAHRRIADALEAIAGQGRPVAAADMAHHFVAAGPEHLGKGLDYSVKAAEEAMRRLAFKDAVRHYEQALSLHGQLAHPGAVGEIDLLIALGNAERQAGVGDYRSTLARAATAAVGSNDGSRLMQAVLADSRGFSSVTGMIDHELVELLEQALLICPEDVPERALLLAALCSELQYHPDVERRRHLARSADELCTVLGDARLTVTVANRMFSSVQTSLSLAELLQKTESTLRAAEEVGDPDQLFWAHLWRTYALRSAGAEREALAQLAAAAAQANDLGQPLLTWWVTNVAAVGALVAGNAGEAERLAGEALPMGTAAGQPDASVLHQAVLTCAAWEQGRLGAAVPIIDAALAERPDDLALELTRVLAHTDTDDVAACRQCLDQLESRLARLPFASTLQLALTIYAEAAIRSGDAKSAGTLIGRLTPWSDQVVHTGATAAGPISHFLGGLHSILGAYDEADEWYERAKVISDGMSATFFGARTNLDRGVMLLARKGPRDLERARAMLAQALAVAKSVGYASIERRAVVALGALEDASG